MSEQTNISWCDSTFNPWIGCTKVSPGCDNCYAEADFDHRKHRVKWGAGNPRSRTSASNWKLPLRWERDASGFMQVHGRRRRVFCGSLCDVFDNEVDPAWRRDLFSLIEATPNLDWLLLTKRIGNAARMIRETDFPAHRAWPWSNVWLGATVVNQAEADRDIPKLLATPAAVRFLSIEPMLGPIDLTPAYLPCPNAEDMMMCPETGAYECCGKCDYTGIGDEMGIDWVIAGGESGPNDRPPHPNWFRNLRDQCAQAGVAFNLKQHGEWREPLEGEEFDTSMGRAANPPAFIISERDGTVRCFESDDCVNGKAVIRVGKARAGRLLDGVLHDGYPKVEA